MRLSTDEDRDDVRASETIETAALAGITVFDTAHSYGRDDTELGHNERLLARALRATGAHETARIVTKGGMTRVGGGWISDGRAKTLRADCEASLEALDGLPIDLYLVHAPDPRTPWQTSVRALARLADDGLVRRVGLSNVNRTQLDEALELAPISAVQVALSPLDDHALRGGVVDRCVELGIAVIAHSPLGGPRRVRSISRIEPLLEVATRHEATPTEIALAWLLDLAPNVVAIPGARRPETARSAAQAASLQLEDRDRAVLAGLGGERSVARRGQPSSGGGSEVVIVMGIPGAGKTRLAEELVAGRHLRLNRDERGGSLRDLAAALDDALARGRGPVVLDNTYLTRASRSYVVEAAARHGASARCVWLDTPLAQAHVNLAERLLERFGRLPAPDELKEAARTEEGLLAPTRQMRALRELEPPDEDEGFARVERIPFARSPTAGRTRAGVFVAAPALERPGWHTAPGEGDATAPHLVFDWRPGGVEADLAPVGARLSEVVSGPVETAICPHGGGPPVCWCRPPLPGLLLEFSRNHGIDPASSLLIGTSGAHRTLAATLGARYADV